MSLFPPIEPYSKFYLDVSFSHKLYVEQVGNPQGIPIVFLHGGPGSGIDVAHRQLFDPEKFLVILFDQRGSGQSKPYGSIEENTTSDLIEDLEKIRKHLGISKWHVFGGSWGSFLALAYAIKFPQYVESMILRGLFLGRKEELEFFYQKGARFLYPEEFEIFISCLNQEEQQHVIQSFYKHLCNKDEKHVEIFARHWALWEASCLRLVNTKKTISEFAKHERIVSLAKIESHYFVHDCFIQKNELLDNAYHLNQIPITLVHGRYDVVCPVENAFLLKKRLPHLNLIIAPCSGHSYLEKEILESLLKQLELIK